MKRVLFVCLGNICRSPAAEGIFQKLIDENHLQKKIECDSAGTSGYHQGEPADARMIMHSKRRGYDLTSISRAFVPEDFNKFDLVVAMDDKNFFDLKEMLPSEDLEAKLVRIVDYCEVHEVPGVPDPYSGGADGFEVVLDILEDGCEQLLKKFN